jgi:hypothetical protein
MTVLADFVAANDQPADAPAGKWTSEPFEAGGRLIRTTLFMDYHEDLKLSAEAIARIAEDARHGRADGSGVRQVALDHNPRGKVYCLLQRPDKDAVRQHHAALGVHCGEAQQVDSLTRPGQTAQWHAGSRQ